MYSQSSSSPDFTISPRPSTMWVCGVIGYAQITCGRQSAIASATAREPSACLSMDALRLARGERERRAGRRDILLRDRGGEFLADRGQHGREEDLAGERREAGQQRGVG